MKLQLALDMLHIEQALALAALLQEHVDIIEIGTLLLYAHGAPAIKLFREALPSKTILADMKIVDRGKDSSSLAFRSGADWVTVLAGTGKSVIHATTATAHELGKYVMLDLIDAPSVGQSALEAASLGVDALIFHKPVDEEEGPSTLIDQWEMVRGNTKLPIYISAPLTPHTGSAIIDLNPSGIVLGQSITSAANPVLELEQFKNLIRT